MQPYIESSDQPFLQEEGVLGYEHVYLVKEAVVRTESTNPQDVSDEIASMKLADENAVKSWPIDRITFKDNGMLEGAPTILAQWQDTGYSQYIETDASPSQLPHRISRSARFSGRCTRLRRSLDLAVIGGDRAHPGSWRVTESTPSLFVS